MYNVLLDLVNKEVDEKQVFELANFLDTKSSNLVLYFSEIPKNVLTKIKRKKLQTLTLIRVGSETSSDAVVKDFVQNHGDGNIILIKRGAENVDKFVLEEMMKEHESGNKIVTAKSKKDDGFWRNLFIKVRNFVISILYNFGLFDGNAQLILFDKSLTKSMRQIPNSIVRMTKVDNFKCVARANIVDNDLRTKVKNKSKKQSLKMWLGHSILILLILTLVLTLIFLPTLRILPFIVAMSLMILAGVCVCFAFTSSFVLFHAVGELVDKDIKIKGEIL